MEPMMAPGGRKEGTSLSLGVGSARVDTGAEGVILQVETTRKGNDTRPIQNKDHTPHV